MEDIVTFDLAVKLKNKGFNIPFYFYYRTDDQLLRHANIANPLVYGDEVDDEVIIAPTISQVLKWLREEKDIDLVISPVFFYDGVLGKMREYGCKVFALSLNKPEHCGYHEEWEQAAIAGIEYVINNII